MPSLASFPICRISCGPDALIAYGILVTALLAIISISISGFGILLKLALILLTASYAIQCIRHYKKQVIYTLESNAHGALFLVDDSERHALERVAWRDWGFLMEFQAIMQGNPICRCWLIARLTDAESRQLRLMIRAQNKKASNSMPSIITNPVL